MVVERRHQDFVETLLFRLGRLDLDALAFTHHDRVALKEAIKLCESVSQSWSADSASKRMIAGADNWAVYNPIVIIRRLLSAVGDEAPLSIAGPDRLVRGRVVGPYRLVKRLGSGFSAEVWAATVVEPPQGVSLRPGDSVAVKFYSSTVLAQPEQSLRIQREFNIAHEIEHDHLIRVHEFMVASPRPHHSFLVMDLARGDILSDALRAGPLDPQVAVTIAAQLFEAVAALHERGVCHRDVKPANVAVDFDVDPPHATLLDLGIVSVMDERALTATSHFIGSKHWAPFEQLTGKTVDEQSDIYSVAAVALGMLTGRKPSY